ncbi:DUF3829 domain-containing protein [Rhizobium sp.]
MRKIVSFLIAAGIGAGVVLYNDKDFKSVLSELGLKDLFGQSTAASSGARPSGPDAQLSEKMQAFVNCNNRVNRAFRNNFESYAKLYEARDGGNVEDTPFVSMNHFSSFKVEVYEQNNEMSKQCADELDKAVAAQPVDADLDRVGRSYASTLRTLLPVVNDIDRYYAQKNYRDDAMKQGRALDAKLRPLMTKLAADGDEINRLLTERTAGLRDRELVAHEKARGRDADWHLQNTMIVARRAIEDIEKSATGKQPTLAEVKAIEAKLDAAYTAGVEYAKANPPADPARKPIWFFVEADVSRLVTAVKEVRRTLETDPASAKAISDINAAFSSYNSLVRNYNLRANLGG